MEYGELEYKVVMEDESFDGKPPSNSEVLGRLAHLALATAAFWAAVAQFPKRNIDLRHGARIIRQHKGAPKPPPAEPIDYALPLWRVVILRGKGEELGTVRAKDEASAREAAIERFGLNELRQKRLAVYLQRSG